MRNWERTSQGAQDTIKYPIIALLEMYQYWDIFLLIKYADLGRKRNFTYSLCKIFCRYGQNGPTPLPQSQISTYSQVNWAENEAVKLEIFWIFLHIVGKIKKPEFLKQNRSFFTPFFIHSILIGKSFFPRYWQEGRFLTSSYRFSRHLFFSRLKTRLKSFQMSVSLLSIFSNESSSNNKK